MNNERMQLGYLDVFNNLNAKNILASGVNTNQLSANSGLFSSLDLNNIDVLSLSGVDINITNGNVSLTNRPTVNGTGVVLIGELNPVIVSTGILLNNKINSLSGYVNSQDIIFSGQISNTGSRLDNKIDSLSGYVTGITGTFGTLPANLYTTGSTLDAKINSLSGYVNSRDNLFSGQISSTGSNLYNSILSLSGLFTTYTGSLDATFASDAQLFATGSTLDNKINSLSGYVNSQDIIFSGQIALSGTRLDNKINSLSGYVDSKSITLPTTIVYTTGDQLISGNKTFLNNVNISGTGDFNNVKISNIDKLFLSGIDIVVTGNSSVNIYNTIYISGNPVLTGVIPQSQTIANIVYTTGDQIISGNKTFLNNVNISGTGTFNSVKISSIDKLFLSGIDMVITGNSSINVYNAIYISGNPVLTGVDSSSYATISNLFATGSTLDNKINSLSGSSASVVSLASTGSTLDSKINSLSGYINSQDIVFSGQTFNTGSRLDNKINSLSGYVNSQDNVFSGQTFNTGSRLDNKINNLSGYINSLSSNIVFTTGNQSISGIKTFIGNHNIIGDTTISGFINISGNYDIYSQIENAKKLAIAYAIVL